MIPDNIQANIMKYLNNGVSGSIQPQKPKFIENEIAETTFRYYPLTNNYKTDDEQFIVNAGMGREIVSDPNKCLIVVWSVNNLLQNEAYLKFEFPEIGNYKPDIPEQSINRDEDGRFYTIAQYINKNDTTDYKTFLILFNDFITDGILQVNAYYDLGQITDTIDGINITYSPAGIVYKKDGSYYLAYYLNYSNIAEYIIIGKYTINVGQTNEIKSYYYKTNDYSTTNSRYHLTMNTETDNIYGMFTYMTTNNTTKCMYFSIPTNDTQLLTTKQIFNKTGLLGTTSYGIYNNKGNYIDLVLYIKNGNTYTYKYVFGRADGTNYETTIPITETTTTDLLINYTIYENFLFIRVYDIENIDIRKFYRINQNTLEFIQDIPTTAIINYARIEFLRQYNLYYMFAFRPGVTTRLFLIRDVPTYGRDCILKQKLFNSKLFRAIKKYRNRHTNI